jgi:hypothetical protein
MYPVLVGSEEAWWKDPQANQGPSPYDAKVYEDAGYDVFDVLYWLIDRSCIFYFLRRVPFYKSTATPSCGSVHTVSFLSFE